MVSKEEIGLNTKECHPFGDIITFYNHNMNI